MSSTDLSHASSLNPGADLWITAGLSESHWTRKLNWYVNFQLSWAEQLQSPTLSPVITDWLEACEIPNQRYHPKNKNCWLISSHQWLPNRWTMMLKYDDDLKTWVKNISDSWNQLSQPSLRLFLPPQCSKIEFEKIWTTHNEIKDISFVVD